ncbi:MAG: histidine--tRNA ligase [Lactobacillales bacterium]|jgi:histidyl-tRNA synthetase|nr:histidine--tRNA ligase [Lactobacillales bacterium]
MAFQRPKGTADILPAQAKKWQKLEAAAAEVFAQNNIEEIRTPMFEAYEVFSRSSGETSDVVSKEMYDFYDKGERHISLRPEGTAGVVRAYIENKLFAPEVPKPVKLWYKGPMFRYERPQAGRMRQFNQIGLEILGSASPLVDAESIYLAIKFYKKLGFKNLKVAINSLGDKESRDAYRTALLDYLAPFKDDLSEDSKRRLDVNPLRILDSKDKKDKEITANAPQVLDYLNETSKEHFNKVLAIFDELDVEYVVDQSMVRGLDYYCHTIFEIMTTVEAYGGNELTICAGGRYDGLAELLGGEQTPGFGFAMGCERVLALIPDDEDDKQIDYFVLNVGDGTEIPSQVLVEKLRAKGYNVERDYLGRKLKGQFKAADKANAKFNIFVGSEELADESVKLRNNETKEESVVKIAELVK